MKRFSLLLFLILGSFLSILGNAAVSLSPKASLDNLSVADYLKLYYSDNPANTLRVRGILDDTLNWLIAADVFSREIQDKPLFCANKKDDPVNIDVDSFNDILMSNMSWLDAYNNVISVKAVLPFTYYVLGVMEINFPCQDVKSHFDLFGKIKESYLMAQSKQKLL